MSKAQLIILILNLANLALNVAVLRMQYRIGRQIDEQRDLLDELS